MTRAWGDGISKWWYLGHATLWIISGIICYFDHKNGPHAAEARRHLVRSLWIGFVTWTFFIIFTTVPYESAPPGNTVTSATTTKVTPGPTTVPEYGSAGQGAVRVAEPKTPVVSRMPEPPDPCSEISTADQARELLRYIDTYDGCLVIYGEVGFGFGDSFYLRVGGDDFLTSESIEVYGRDRYGDGGRVLDGDEITVYGEVGQITRTNIHGQKWAEPAVIADRITARVPHAPQQQQEQEEEEEQEEERVECQAYYDMSGSVNSWKRNPHEYKCVAVKARVSVDYSSDKYHLCLGMGYSCGPSLDILVEGGEYDAGGRILQGDIILVRGATELDRNGEPYINAHSVVQTGRDTYGSQWSDAGQ